MEPVTIARIATSVASLLARLCGPPKGARTVDAPVKMGRRLKRADRTLEAKDTAKIASTLARRLSDANIEVSHLDPQAGEEVLAAVEAALGANIPMDDAQNVYLSREGLRELLETRVGSTASLPDRAARDVYDRLMDACCAHVVEFFTAQPEFVPRTLTELRIDQGRVLDRLPPPIDDQDARFAARYARSVRARLNRAQLFGVVELDADDSSYDLTTAFVHTPLTGDLHLPTSATSLAVARDMAALVWHTLGRRPQVTTDTVPTASPRSPSSLMPGHSRAEDQLALLLSGLVLESSSPEGGLPACPAESWWRDRPVWARRRCCSGWPWAPSTTTHPQPPSWRASVCRSC